MMIYKSKVNTNNYKDFNQTNFHFKCMKSIEIIRSGHKLTEYIEQVHIH